MMSNLLFISKRSAVSVRIGFNALQSHGINSSSSSVSNAVTRSMLSASLATSFTERIATPVSGSDSAQSWNNKFLVGAAAMAVATTAAVTSTKDATTQCEQPLNQQSDGETRRLSRRRSYRTKDGLRDPMTIYAVKAMEREEKRRKAYEAEVVAKKALLQSKKENVQQQVKVELTPKVLEITPSIQQVEVVSNKASIQATSSTESENDENTMLELPLLSEVSSDDDTSSVDMTPTPKDVDETMTQSEAKIEEATRKAKQHSGGLKVFSGNGNMSLALEICRHLGVNLGKATVGKFADGEVNVVIQENVRGKDVYVVQPTGPPVNDNIMELLLMVSTLRRSSARRITVVIPYYGYARQDRKMQARVPISAADVARLMESMGIDRVIAVDLHCGQIQGFFGPRVPVDNLDGGIVGLDYFGCKDLHNPVIVSPDAGGVYRAKNFKEGLEHKYEMHDLSLAMIVKQRAKAGIVDSMDLVGDVRDCDCIIVDDMIDTAGTLCKASDVLIANGARRVFAFASHGLLSGPGNERIANSSLEEVVILNTLPTSPQREANEKLTELSVAPLLAQAIFNIHAKKSISALFK